MTEVKSYPQAGNEQEKYHKLLLRQLMQTNHDINNSDLEHLYHIVSQTYADYDQEIALGNNACDIASQELVEANRIIRQQCAQYELALSGSNDGLWDWNCETQEVFYSPRWTEMLGFTDSRNFKTLDDWFNLIHSDYKNHVKMELEIHLSGKSERFECEYKILNKEGDCIWVLTRGKASHDEVGNVIRVAGAQTDITRQKEYQNQLAHVILHDTLTGLPNRTLLTTRIEHFINKISRSKKLEIRGAILYINIDRFKLINDNMGREKGDIILKEFTQRMEKFLRPGDTLARLGSDEFVILLENINHIDTAQDIALRIGKMMDTPFLIKGESISISVSIGICGIYNNKNTVDTILRNGDMALSQAKLLGRRRFFVYNETISIDSMGQLRMEKDLHLAIERKELFLLYQPIINLTDYSIAGFEALVRWNHPALGVISPFKFIPIAEESGLIRPIGEFVLKTACDQLMKWKSHIFHRNPKSDISNVLNKISSISMSVNLSINQLSDPSSVAQLLSIIDGYDFEDFSIKLELTESTLAQNIDLCKCHLEMFKSKKIELCIDDFGTGFSSLTYLDSFPFDILKIDRHFVTRMENDEKSAKMVVGIINLSHDLKYKIIAEGVETIEQLNLLKKMKCEFGQGYYFSPPVAAPEAEHFIFNGFPHLHELAEEENKAFSIKKNLGL